MIGSGGLINRDKMLKKKWQIRQLLFGGVYFVLIVTLYYLGILEFKQRYPLVGIFFSSTLFGGVCANLMFLKQGYDVKTLLGEATAKVFLGVAILLVPFIIANFLKPAEAKKQLQKSD